MTGSRFTRWLALTGLIIAGVSVLALAVAGPGYRLGWWELQTAFRLFRWAAWGGIAGGSLGLIALLSSLLFPATGLARRSVVAVALALVAFGLPWYWLSKARSVPPIHDISTDLEDPPAFRAILPLRADAPNPAEHGGPEIAAQQREAYPDVRTMTFDAPRETVFDAAESAARAMGWELIAADRGEGRIEAVATTTWFGFRDDVVVRIGEGAPETIVDVRSVSRVGRSDVGANAERIREYTEALQSRLEARSR